MPKIPTKMLRLCMTEFIGLRRYFALFWRPVARIPTELSDSCQEYMILNWHESFLRKIFAQNRSVSLINSTFYELASLGFDLVA